MMRKPCILMTIPEAIEQVGLDTIEWILADWHHRITTMLSTSWYTNRALHPAYDVLSRASVWEVRNQLTRWSPDHVS